MVAAPRDYYFSEDDPASTAEKLVLSVRRNVTPLAVGTAGTWLAMHGLDMQAKSVNKAGKNNLIGGLIQGGLGLAARL